MSDESEAIREIAESLTREQAEGILEGHPCACMGPPAGVDTNLCHCAVYAAAARKRLEDKP